MNASIILIWALVIVGTVSSDSANVTVTKPAEEGTKHTITQSDLIPGISLEEAQNQLPVLRQLVADRVAGPNPGIVSEEEIRAAKTLASFLLPQNATDTQPTA